MKVGLVCVVDNTRYFALSTPLFPALSVNVKVSDMQIQPNNYKKLI